jgi:hypothetical protein
VLGRVGTTYSSQAKKEAATAGHTVVIHGLLESFVSLLQHLCVNVYNFYGGFPVVVLFPCMVKNTESNVTCSTGYINATKGSSSSRIQSRDKRVLPQSMNAQRRRVVHEVILGCDGVEDVANEILFCFLRDCAETKRGSSSR